MNTNRIRRVEKYDNYPTVIFLIMQGITASNVNQNFYIRRLISPVTIWSAPLTLGIASYDILCCALIVLPHIITAPNFWQILKK